MSKVISINIILITMYILPYFFNSSIIKKALWLSISTDDFRWDEVPVMTRNQISIIHY